MNYDGVCVCVCDGDAVVYAHNDDDVRLTVTVTLYLGISRHRLDDDWLTATDMADGDGDAIARV